MGKNWYIRTGLISTAKSNVMVQWSRNHLRLSVTTRHAITLAVKGEFLCSGVVLDEIEREVKRKVKRREKRDKRFISLNTP